MPYFSSIPTLNNPMTPALPVRLDRQNAGRLPAGYGTGRESLFHYASPFLILAATI